MLYKVVTKVIVNRLRPLMEMVAKQNQASSVPCRCISNNIVVTQEVVHLMQNFIRRKMGIALKIDLKRAYNRIRWDFFGRYVS